MSVATLTAYCACTLCCGPSAPQPTASGVFPRQGITIAAPRSVPLGTIVRVQGLGNFVVQDRTAIRFDGRWDVFFKRHKDALKFGKQRRQVTIIQKRK